MSRAGRVPPEGETEPDLGFDPGEVHLSFPSDPMAVRQALDVTLQRLAVLSLPLHQRETVELVLAEVLNNVVEHAYRAESGAIELHVIQTAAGLSCAILDHGAPMPAGRLPEADADPVAGSELPEGGFGWNLIRRLSQDLSYERSQGRNCLRFRLGAALLEGQNAPAG